MPLVIKAAVQKYAWGKLGTTSAVAKFAAAGKHGVTVEEEQPYAELWMGTHPNGPSTVCLENGEAKSLADLITADPSMLGEGVKATFGPVLPFLFKVLSVNKSLSIQAHPNKAHAEALHAANPSVYKDPNHKPEMCIALTEFEGLCGFRPAEEITGFLKGVPELRAVAGEKPSDAFVLAYQAGSDVSGPLKECFGNLMTCEDGTVATHLASLVARLQGGSGETGCIPAEVAELVGRLNSQFPGDVGVFCAFLLNRVVLQPGQAMFLAANLPHAYLSGDCLECMACSDNVVRAGLTPKFKDVSTLVAMLDYTCGSARERVLAARVDPHVSHARVYDPPVPDFAVELVEFSGESLSLHGLPSANLALITEGKMAVEFGGTKKELEAGHVLLLSAGESCTCDVLNAPLKIARAYCSC